MIAAQELLTPPASTPWWAVVGVIVATILTPAASAIVVALINRPMRRGIAQVAADARITRDQTTNSHTTNLRDDLDGLRSAVDRIGLDVGGLRADERQTRKDLGRTDERVTDLAGRLDHHLNHQDN